MSQAGWGAARKAVSATRAWGGGCGVPGQPGGRIGEKGSEKGSGTDGVKLGRFLVPKGRQDLAGGFSRRIRSGNGASPEGTAEGGSGLQVPGAGGPLRHLLRPPKPETRNLEPLCPVGRLRPQHAVATVAIHKVVGAGSREGS